MPTDQMASNLWQPIQRISAAYVGELSFLCWKWKSTDTDLNWTGQRKYSSSLICSSLLGWKSDHKTCLILGNENQ